MKDETQIVNRVILGDESQQPIVVTSHQLAEFCRNTVLVTLREMGLKTDRLQSGRVYKTDVVPEVISEREWQSAVRRGLLPVWKKNPLKKNSRTYTRRKDYDNYLKSKFNREV